MWKPFVCEKFEACSLPVRARRAGREAEPDRRCSFRGQGRGRAVERLSALALGAFGGGRFGRQVAAALLLFALVESCYVRGLQSPFKEKQKEQRLVSWGKASALSLGRRDAGELCRSHLVRIKESCGPPVFGGS